MRTARLALLGLALALFAACEASEITAPVQDLPEVGTEVTQKRNCGYLGSAGCL